MGGKLTKNSTKTLLNNVEEAQRRDEESTNNENEVQVNKKVKKQTEKKIKSKGKPLGNKIDQATNTDHFLLMYSNVEKPIDVPSSVDSTNETITSAVLVQTNEAYQLDFVSKDDINQDVVELVETQPIISSEQTEDSNSSSAGMNCEK